MASLERIVRPVLPPSIRVAVAQDAAPLNDPTKDVITLTGSSGRLVSLSHSASVNWSKELESAFFRIYDLVRIFHKNDQTGAVDTNQYVDAKVTTFRRYKDSFGIVHQRRDPHPQEADNIQILQRDVRENISDSRLGGA